MEHFHAAHERTHKSTHNTPMDKRMHLMHSCRVPWIIPTHFLTILGYRNEWIPKSRILLNNSNALDHRHALLEKPHRGCTPPSLYLSLEAPLLCPSREALPLHPCHVARQAAAHQPHRSTLGLPTAAGLGSVWGGWHGRERWRVPSWCAAGLCCHVLRWRASWQLSLASRAVIPPARQHSA